MFDEHFWVAVSFVCFVLAVYKPVAGFIAKALDSKIARIRSELEDVLKLKHEAEAILKAYREKNANAEKEAAEIIENARLEAKEIIDEAKKSLEYAITKRTELATQKIAQAEAEALRSIKDNAVDITVSAAKSLIMENLSREASEELLLSAIESLERKFH